MELRLKINRFDYFNNDVKIGSSFTENEIAGKNFIDTSFPFRQIIGFFDSSNTYIKLDLLGNLEETKIKKLSSRNFSISTLVLLSKIMNLELLKSNSDVTNLKIPANRSIASIAFKKCRNGSILVVYNLELPDLYRGAGVFDGKLYIHRILEASHGEIINMSWLSDILIY